MLDGTRGIEVQCLPPFHLFDQDTGGNLNFLLTSKAQLPHPLFCFICDYRVCIGLPPNVLLWKGRTPVKVLNTTLYRDTKVRGRTATPPLSLIYSQFHITHRFSWCVALSPSGLWCPSCLPYKEVIVARRPRSIAPPLHSTLINLERTTTTTTSTD